ncbi:hypothetical protein K488DRAFT_71411 [Vararia minispora EC-137]|uniref:Uncharacterized protein n=1 Tax=Vararia minispora EC-137 TaxID=1314806 RepID=A0ACB8QI03_9AGAM|nr:hypothetical protein K488DRAFT_71411 [Vararia minispora EC-137]
MASGMDGRDCLRMRDDDDDDGGSGGRARELRERCLLGSGDSSGGGGAWREGTKEAAWAAWAEWWLMFVSSSLYSWIDWRDGLWYSTVYDARRDAVLLIFSLSVLSVVPPPGTSISMTTGSPSSIAADPQAPLIVFSRPRRRSFARKSACGRHTKITLKPYAPRDRAHRERDRRDAQHRAGRAVAASSSTEDDWRGAQPTQGPVAYQPFAPLRHTFTHRARQYTALLTSRPDGSSILSFESASPTHPIAPPSGLEVYSTKNKRRLESGGGAFKICALDRVVVRDVKAQGATFKENGTNDTGIFGLRMSWDIRSPAQIARSGWDTLLARHLTLQWRLAPPSTSTPALAIELGVEQPGICTRLSFTDALGHAPVSPPEHFEVYEPLSGRVVRARTSAWHRDWSYFALDHRQRFHVRDASAGSGGVDVLALGWRWHVLADVS